MRKSIAGMVVATIFLVSGAASAAAWEIDLGDYKLSGNDHDVVAKKGGSAVFALSSVARDNYERVKTALGEAPRGYERIITILSVVGTIVSFEDSYNADYGGAHPAHETRFTAIDLARPGTMPGYKDPSQSLKIDLARRGKVALLTDYFRAEDIYQALSKDSFVKKYLDTARPPRNLDELVSQFASGYASHEDLLTRFAFHHINGNQVAVRIGLSPNSGTCCLTELGIYLPIPVALKQPIADAASAKHGFLTKTRKEVYGQVVTIPVEPK